MSRSPDIEASAEVRALALDAISGLARTLGKTLEVEEVVRRALLTVSGQFLTRRSAFYLWSPSQGALLRAGTLGLRPGQLPARIPGPRPPLTSRDEDFVRAIDSGFPFDGSWTGSFEYAATIDDGEESVGVLLLGGALTERVFEEQDRHLLQVMGVILGTTVGRAVAFEQIQHAKRELENAARIRQEVLDHVSHEFNTPLMVLRSGIDLLDSADGEEAQELMGMMDGAPRRLEYRVRSILAMCEGPQPGGIEEVPAARVGEWVSQVASSTSVLEWGVPRTQVLELPGRVRLDRATVGTVLETFVSNAWKFQPPGEDAWVVVQAYLASREWWEAQDPRARIAWYDDAIRRQVTDLSGGLDCGDPLPGPDASDVLVVEVADAGVGIPPAEQELVFEAFSQASNSATHGICGAGIGLPVARRAAEAAGGELRVRSVAGVGSLFALLVPWEPEAPGS